MVTTDRTYDQMTLNPTFSDWEQQDQILLSRRQLTPSSAILSRVLGCVHSFEFWEKIHDYFYKQTRVKARHLGSELRATTLSDHSVSEYLLRIKALVDSLATVGDLVPLQEYVDVILEGLRSSVP